VTTHYQSPDSFRPWKLLERRELFSLPGRLVVAMDTIELPDGRRVDDYLQLRLADFVVVFAETAHARYSVCGNIGMASAGPAWSWSRPASLRARTRR
jgi:hypothetical protein